LLLILLVISYRLNKFVLVNIFYKKSYRNIMR
jgi:hypothetical protein